MYIRHQITGQSLKEYDQEKESNYRLNKPKTMSITSSIALHSVFYHDDLA